MHLQINNQESESLVIMSLQSLRKSERENEMLTKGKIIDSVLRNLIGLIQILKRPLDEQDIERFSQYRFQIRQNSDGSFDPHFLNGFQKKAQKEAQANV